MAQVQMFAGQQKLQWHHPSVYLVSGEVETCLPANDTAAWPASEVAQNREISGCVLGQLHTR